MGELIPLFPLGTPLFPGMVLPLHVFEPRYRRLVLDLLALPEENESRFFGVVAIRQGWEVERVAPAGTMTEAFAWLATALAVGSAAGAAAGGALTQHAGATGAFLLAGGAGALAMVTAALRADTLGGRPAAAAPVTRIVEEAAAAPA